MPHTHSKAIRYHSGTWSLEKNRTQAITLLCFGIVDLYSLHEPGLAFFPSTGMGLMG